MIARVARLRIKRMMADEGTRIHLGQRVLCQISNNTEESIDYAPSRTLKMGAVDTTSATLSKYSPLIARAGHAYSGATR
jgi:hypothetical protein